MASQAEGARGWVVKSVLFCAAEAAGPAAAALFQQRLGHPGMQNDGELRWPTSGARYCRVCTSSLNCLQGGQAGRGGGTQLGGKALGGLKAWLGRFHPLNSTKPDRFLATSGSLFPNQSGSWLTAPPIHQHPTHETDLSVQQPQPKSTTLAPICSSRGSSPTMSSCRALGVRAKACANMGRQASSTRY